MGTDQPSTRSQTTTTRRSVPVVIGLHGKGGDPEQINQWLKLDAEANQKGVLSIIPAGTPEDDADLFWNAGTRYSQSPEQSAADADYLTSLVDEAGQWFNIDRDRVYLIGHSNGGFMSYQLLCQRPEVFAGAAVIAASDQFSAEECDGRGSVLITHGLEDNSISYNGYDDPDPDRSYPGVTEVAAKWAQIDQCDPEPTQGGEHRSCSRARRRGHRGCSLRGLPSRDGR